MNELDWTEKIDILSDKELQKLLIMAVGMLSVYPPFQYQTPDQIFDYLFELAEKNN